MCRACAVAVSWCLAVGLAVPATAQTLQGSSATFDFVEPLSPDQEEALDAWLAAMESWRRYDAKHQNRPARDVLGRVAARRPMPAAPAWLPQHCAAAANAGIGDLEERIATACRLLVDPQASPARVQAQASRDAAEQPDRYSSFLTRIHLDGLGITTSSGPRVYGIIGSHLTLVDVGRVQVFGPPGVLLLSVPDAGGRRMTLGYTWGVSLRLTDVNLLKASRRMTLFLTFSKLWVNGAGPDASGLQIVSLSLAPRKK